MFRRGGQADGGVTSGLRKGYDTGGQTGMERIQRDLAMIDQLAPQRKGALNDFMINFGLNMVGNPPSGGIFQTAAKEAQQPFQQFQQSRAQESLGRRELIANMVQNLSEDDKYKLWAEAESIFEAGGMNPFTNQPFKSAQEAFDTLLKNKFMSKERVLTEEAKFENTYNEYLNSILREDEGDFAEDRVGASRLAQHEAKVWHKQYPKQLLDEMDGAQYIPLGAVDWNTPNPDGSFPLTEKVGVNAMNFGTLKANKVYFNVADTSFYKFNGKSFTVVDIAEYN
tara:strand:- start:158 stop:1003 length:846 start_codon:yes stop_codon:yes gene_type:complete